MACQNLALVLQKFRSFPCSVNEARLMSMSKKIPSRRSSVLWLVAALALVPCVLSAQTEPQDCDLEAKNCVGPTRATPEVVKPELPPTGNAKVPTLPKGRAPIGENINARLEQRNAMRETMPEAAYKLSVEIGRHLGLALDGKESYEELDRMIMEQKAEQERQRREQATVASTYTSCSVPGSSSSVREGATTCLKSFAPALCPSCRENWVHRCERIGSGIDVAGVWRPIEECNSPAVPTRPIRGLNSDSAAAQLTQTTEVNRAQSDCDFLLENIASLGSNLSVDNVDAKYNELQRICGGDMSSCMQKIQACGEE